MDTQFFDVMVDIETTGTSPDDSAIIQLAAVKFNLAERKLDTTTMFCRSLAIPQKRFWDEDTRRWWGQQKREILQDIYSKMEDPKVVMQAFADWCGYNHEQPLRFWAKPTHFDYSFVQSYFNQFEVLNPFHYRWATDVNSFIRGLAGTSEVEQFKTDFQGDAHNALFDVINQIDAIFKAKDHYENPA